MVENKIARGIFLALTILTMAIIFTFSSQERRKIKISKCWSNNTNSRGKPKN